MICDYVNMTSLLPELQAFFVQRAEECLDFVDHFLQVVCQLASDEYCMHVRREHMESQHERKGLP
jgi:hypothetical protein